MKIAITGGNKGLGASLAQAWLAHGHTVDVFSRSNGYNIVDVDRMVNAVINHDVLINNAYCGHAQTDLLYAIFLQWQGQRKYIINVSSEMTTRMVSYEITGTVAPLRWPQGQRDPGYRTAKIALEDAQHFLAQQNQWPRMQMLRPGMLDTPREGFVPVGNDQRNKIDTNALAEWLYQNWANRDQFWVSEITVNPLDWYKIN